jgi:hypothetical protein
VPSGVSGGAVGLIAQNYHRTQKGKTRAGTIYFHHMIKFFKNDFW